MINKQPIEAQIKELWAWCGLCSHDWDFLSSYSPPDPDNYSKCKKCGLIIEGHNYRQYQLPSLDLNNLFKYAVPKLLPKHDFSIYWVLDVDSPDGAWSVSMANTPGPNIRLRHQDPALALFWAIWKVIKE